MATPELPFVSVIIPVYNQSELLVRCLAALAQQTYPRSRYEIIVIDNASDDAAAVAAAIAPYENIRLTYEAQPGSYVARNQGMRLAQGEIFAFTDADCAPAADWLAQGVQELMAHPDCGQVIGEIEIFFADPQHPTPVELYEQITAFPQARLLQELHGGATANLFTRRSVMDAVGPFDPQLKSNGDLEWGQRVYAQGYAQRYAPSVLVKHPARAQWSELTVRTQRLLGGQYERQLKAAASRGERHGVFIKLLLFHLMPPVFFTVNAFRDRRLHSLNHKLQVSGVMVIVRAISTWELLRLKAGMTSARS
ncbi:MAG: glycosyltransferase [Leptolyngbyaceae cyanobacterium]